MPLRTQVIDCGATEPRRLPHGWGGFHLDALAWFMDLEGRSPDLGWPDNYEFTDFHKVVDESDGEVFIIRPGDRFVCWRD